MASRAFVWDYILLLSNPAIILSFVGLLLLADVLRRVARWGRLRHIPGPPLAGWTSLWLTRAYFKEGYLENYQSLTDKYGPVVRVGPNSVLCSDVDTLYKISGVRSPYKKHEWYTMSKVSKRGEHTLSLLEPEPRRERKKYIGPAYGGRGGANFEEGADRAIAAFINLIERKYLSTPGRFVPVNLGEKIHYWALDSIGEIAYSNSFGMLEHDKDTYGILAANNGTVPLVKFLSNHLWLWRALHRWPLLYLLPNDGDESGLGAVTGHVRSLVNQRLLPNAPQKHDMLGSFISHSLQGEDLYQEVGIQFFAGSDTVASLVSTTLLLLLTHPPTYTTLQTELDTAHAHHRQTQTQTSSPATTTIITDAQARALPFLQAVIQEGLRLFPPAASGAFWKRVPAGGDTVCGVRLPGGCLVGTAQPVWVAGREDGFWGDGGVFRPGRWLEEKDEERLAQMHRRVELAFGSGQFVCMGRSIALVETNKALAELLRRYNWSLVNPLKPPKVDSPIVWTVEDFLVRIEKR